MRENNNISPSFARLAAEQAREGNVQRAIAICIEGTKAFPNYTTGHFVLGKCYEAFGRTVEALVEYNEAFKGLPDNLTLQMLVKRMEEKEQKELRKSAEGQEKKLGGLQNTLSPERFLDNEPRGEESAIEYLAKRLQDVKRVQPNPNITADSPTAGSKPNAKFVTVTMAEIYAGQGEYQEAITAYTELQRQHPQDGEKFKDRIDELSQLLGIQQQQKSLQPPPNTKASYE